MAQDPTTLTATEAAALIRSRKLSAAELAEACLDRVRRREPEVEAWAHIDPDRVRAAARAADAVAPRSALHGIPFGVKDVIDSADLPTEYGSEIFAGNRPSQDAACIAKMKAAGAVLMGKTVSTEFATYRPGKTRNPVNAGHTPGGSSSGSAAAVGDRMVPIAFGNQTAGSLIRPAAYCGVCALKPTFGTVDLGGILALENSFDTLGYMARSFDDIAAFYGIVRGVAMPPVPDTLPRPPRIGVLANFNTDVTEAPSREAVARAATRLGSLGASVGDVRLPDTYASLPATHATILNVGLSRNLGEIYRTNGNRISERLRGMIEDGLACPPDRLAAAVDHAERCRRGINTVFGDWDVFLCPSAPGEAPEGLGTTGNPIFQLAWTLMHLPCATVPFGLGPRGLPVGVQIIGREGEDETVLRIAKWLHTRQ
ncbi:MAG: amidase [Alphaproteobacteria bacterium]|nr:amidase [Alphaproteobacteria bacterium]